MKTVAGLALLTSLAGCAAPERPVPEGRIPDAGTGTVEKEALGLLTVRTEEPWLGAREDMQRASDDRGGFNVLDEEGRMLRADVQDTAALEPGRYLVEVPGATGHARWFWVTVEAGEVTVVDARKIPAEAR